MRVLLIATVLAFWSCGTAAHSKRKPPPSNPSCTTYPLEDETGIAIECDDGTTSILYHGTAGQQGPAGDPGQAGTSCQVIDTDEGAVIHCEDGSLQEVLDGEIGQTPSVTCYSN